MVNYLSTIFNQNIYKQLSETSDGICADNGKAYIDFDKFVETLYTSHILTGEFLSSCDTLLLNTLENHIIFVEFKDMSSSNNNEKLNTWWNNKSRSIFLKIGDSLLLFSYYLKNHHSKTYDDFMNTPKSFIYVYKSDSFKSKIHSHLKYKFSRYNFMFKNIQAMETKQFENFLTHHNL